jgi:hypothetical protein
MKYHCLWAAAAASLAAGSLLTPDASDLCVARGNGTTFNITALPWPFRFSDSRGYAYTLQSPCARPADVLPCPQHDAAENVVLCQKDHLTAGEFFACGLPQPAMWLLPDAWGMRRWSVLFGGGDTWRVANVTFVVDPTVDPPTAVFLGEEPYLQYNVLITGKCVGQPSYSACVGSTAPEVTKPDGY